MDNAFTMDPMATDNGLVVNNLNHVRTDSQVSRLRYRWGETRLPLHTYLLVISTTTSQSFDTFHGLVVKLDGVTVFGIAIIPSYQFFFLILSFTRVEKLR